MVDMRLEDKDYVITLDKSGSMGGEGSLPEMIINGASN